MSRLRIFLFRLRGLFLKRNLEQELAHEIQSHLEMQIEDNQRLGMGPDEARYAALRKFGGVEQVKEIYRDRRGLPFVETFLRDLGYGGRMLRRTPIITTVAILTGPGHWREHSFIQRGRRRTPENFAGRSARSLGGL
jgi:hypothetical protein